MNAEMVLPLQLQPHQANIEQIEQYAATLSSMERKMSEKHTIPISAYADLARFGYDCWRFNSEYRQAVLNDESLPHVVRNDPPSLRATTWLVMTDEALQESPIVTPKPLESYPWRLYALTRSWLNAADDVMDQSYPPISNKILMNNQAYSAINSRLGVEFLQLYKMGNPNVVQTLSQFTTARDIWCNQYNEVEKSRRLLSFDDSLAYNIETMGIITALFANIASIKQMPSEEKKKELATALVWYAAAGKLIDDMCDWFKDYRRGELNLLTLALEESGELERVSQLTKPLNKLGPKTFLPISFFNMVAPQASQRMYDEIDSLIHQLDSCGFKRFTDSMIGIRDNMWLYALNEGVPQI